VKKMCVKHKLKISAIIAVMMIVIAGAAFLVSILQVKAEEGWRRKTELKVDCVYFVGAQDDNTEDNLFPIIATLYLTQEHRLDSCNIKIVAYLMRENPKLALDKNTVAVGVIGGGKTREIEVKLIVSSLDISHDVDFLIFENDLLVMRGSGSIRVRKVVVGPGNYRFMVEIGRVADFTKVDNSA